MATLNQEKTQAFINRAYLVFKQNGYNSVFRHPTVMAILDEDYAKLGEIRCVADASEVPEAIEDDAIGYSDDGKFYWYLDTDLENAIFDLENTDNYGDANALIFDLVSAAEGPLELEGKQLEIGREGKAWEEIIA